MNDIDAKPRPVGSEWSFLKPIKATQRWFTQGILEPHEQDFDQNFDHDFKMRMNSYKSSRCAEDTATARLGEFYLRSNRDIEPTHDASRQSQPPLLVDNHVANEDCMLRTPSHSWISSNTTFSVSSHRESLSAGKTVGGDSSIASYESDTVHERQTTKTISPYHASSRQTLIKAPKTVAFLDGEDQRPWHIANDKEGILLDRKYLTNQQQLMARLNRSPRRVPMVKKSQWPAENVNNTVFSDPQEADQIVREEVIRYHSLPSVPLLYSHTAAEKLKGSFGFQMADNDIIGDGCYSMAENMPEMARVERSLRHLGGDADIVGLLVKKLPRGGALRVPGHEELKYVDLFQHRFKRAAVMRPTSKHHESELPDGTKLQEGFSKRLAPLRDARISSDDVFCYATWAAHCPNIRKSNVGYILRELYDPRDRGYLGVEISKPPPELGRNGLSMWRSTRKGYKPKRTRIFKAKPASPATTYVDAMAQFHLAGAGLSTAKGKGKEESYLSKSDAPTGKARDQKCAKPLERAHNLARQQRTSSMTPSLRIEDDELAELWTGAGGGSPGKFAVPDQQVGVHEELSIPSPDTQLVADPGVSKAKTTSRGFTNVPVRVRFTLPEHDGVVYPSHDDDVSDGAGSPLMIFEGSFEDFPPAVGTDSPFRSSTQKHSLHGSAPPEKILNATACLSRGKRSPAASVTGLNIRSPTRKEKGKHAAHEARLKGLAMAAAANIDCDKPLFNDRDEESEDIQDKSSAAAVTHRKERKILRIPVRLRRRIVILRKPREKESKVPFFRSESRREARPAEYICRRPPIIGGIGSALCRMM